MSIKLRLGLMLGMLLLAFLISLLLLHNLELHQARQMLATTRQTRADLLDRWIGLTGDSLRQFANDYSQWDDMVRFAGSPDPAWAAINIEAALPNVNAQATWVLGLDGTVRYGVNRWRDASFATPPFPPAEFAAQAARTPFLHFFSPSRHGLLEFRTAPIQPSADIARRSPPVGWLVVARAWDQAQIGMLARLTESTVSLAGADNAAPAPDPDVVHVERPLPGRTGKPAALLILDDQPADLTQSLQASVFAGRVFGGFGLVVILALALSLQLWVLRPLRWIGESLSRGDTAAIAPLAAEGERTELGRVALLIQSSFAQKAQLVREVDERKRAEEALRQSEAALRSTLEERVRLGRDLHDSVIQSLYAAGMGLVGVRAQLREDPGAAEAMIENTREALNETIRDLRNYITGLEPEALKQQPFGQAMERLIQFLNSVQPVQATLSIDETLAGSFSMVQRVHALQIAREAISNAVRHGEASAVRVVLRRIPRGAEFTVEDNGRGFDAGAPRSSGHGLRNLAERAKEIGAELTVASEPGKGTRVTVMFPPSTPS